MIKFFFGFLTNPMSATTLSPSHCSPYLRFPLYSLSNRYVKYETDERYFASYARHKKIYPMIATEVMYKNLINSRWNHVIREG